MMRDESAEEAHFRDQNELVRFDWVEERSGQRHQEENVASPWSYGVRIGRVPVTLGVVEYRILRFLSDRPYHGFTPRQIARGVTDDAFPVTEESIAKWIASLREQLGFFSDYVQTVPHLGYRFKP